MEIMGKLVEERTEAAAHEIAMRDLAATYSARAKRLSARQDAISLAIGQLMDAMGETKIKHPIATISRTKARWSANITDADQIPSQLMNVTTKPDMAAIKKQMDQGESVPGCQFQMGQPSITVRIK